MTFSTEDVKMVLSTISGYLIVLAVLLVVVIAVAVTVRKMDKLKKCLMRWQALFAWLLAVVANRLRSAKRRLLPNRAALPMVV